MGAPKYSDRFAVSGPHELIFEDDPDFGNFASGKGDAPDSDDGTDGDKGKPIPPQNPSTKSLRKDFSEDAHPRDDHGRFATEAGAAGAVQRHSGQEGSAHDASEPVVQTETVAFKAWFGDSKIVDPEGKPLVVYHGTTGQIHAFDAARIGSTDYGLTGHGFYFTPDPSTAEGYAGDLATGEGAAILPVYLSIKNPLELAKMDPAKREELMRKFKEDPKRTTAELQKAGYDGVIGTAFGANPKTQDVFGRGAEIVAFHPEQIKSAIGNHGTFDPRNPDITKAFDETPGD